MPRTRSVLWSELKLGVIAIVAIALVVLIIVAIGGQGGFWWQRYPLKTRFETVNGLKNGAVVRLNGKEVGLVTDVQFAGPQIEVSLELSKEVRKLVTTDSIATVGSLSLLGEPIIDVTASATGTPLADWAYVKSGVAGGPFGALTQTATDTMQQANLVLADIRNGRGTLGKFITDDKVYNELDALVTSAAAVTHQLNAGRGTLGGLIKDPAAYNSLKASLDNLNTITTKINNGEGSLGHLLNDQKLGKSLDSMSASAEQITDRINKGDGTLGKLINERQVYDRLNSLMARFDDMAAGLNSGRGTAGKLLQDQALYENMNRTVTELRDLLADIRKDPKKFLNVKVSIF